MKRHSTWRTTAVTNSLCLVFFVVLPVYDPCCAEVWHDRPQLIQAALSYIPAHDRDTWWKIGMAVKSDWGYRPCGTVERHRRHHKPTDARAV